MAAVDPRAKALTLVACTVGSAIVFVDTTVVNVALPALRDDLDASLAGQQWVVESYLLMLGSLVLVGGSLGDLLGRRRVFALGVAGFGITSVLCAVATTTGLLIAARGLQGVAGALLVPSSLAIITATFEPEERGAAIGSWTAWTSGAIAVGPPLGGLLVDAVSWRLVFAINVPLVLVTLWLIARAVPSFAPAPDPRVDLVGAVLCALGLGGPVFALIAQPSRGWGDALVLVTLVGGLGVLGLFVAYEARTRAPMLPLGLFRARNFAVGNVATVAVYAGLGAAPFFLALFLQQVAGYSALAGGLVLLPITLMLLALSRRFGALALRVGPRLLMGAGPVVAGVGLALFLLLDERGDVVTGVLPGSVVFGLGLAMTVAPLTATVLGAVDERHAGVASGVNNALARIAGLVAIAVVGLAVSARYGAVLDERVGPAPAPALARAAAEAKETPLVPRAVPRDTPQAGRLRAAQVDASVSAFRVGVLVSALLVVAGGLVSFWGIRDPRRPRLPAPANPAPGDALGSGILQGPCPPASGSHPSVTSSSPPSPSSP